MIKNNKPRVVTIFDIDGIVVENMFNIVEPTDENFYKVYKNQKIHSNIINLIETTSKGSDIYFLTGRLIKYKDITLKMLSPIHIKYIVYFHEIEYKDWSLKTYHNHKIEKYNKIAENYDIIIGLDDRKKLLQEIKDKFKFKNKILFLIHAKFINKLNNVQCLEIL